MNGRSTVLILFLWALLTVITPILVRMSASAKLLDGNGVEARERKSMILPRRALIDTKFTAPAQAPLIDTRLTGAAAPASEQACPDHLEPCPGIGGWTLCDCGDINIPGPCFCCLQ